MARQRYAAGVNLSGARLRMGVPPRNVGRIRTMTITRTTRLETGSFVTMRGERTSSESGDEARAMDGHRLRAARALDQVEFSELRRRAVLDGCKWDPQVGDVSTLAAFPLVLSRRVWSALASQ